MKFPYENKQRAVDALEHGLDERATAYAILHLASVVGTVGAALVRELAEDEDDAGNATDVPTPSTLALNDE